MKREMDDLEVGRLSRLRFFSGPLLIMQPLTSRVPRKGPQI